MSLSPLTIAHIEVSTICFEARTKKGYTQLEIANLLGYQSPQFISLFERGLSKIPYETMGRLITILGVSESQIKKILIEGFKRELTGEIQKGKAWK